jgi:serine/threonine protein kinase
MPGLECGRGLAVGIAAFNRKIISRRELLGALELWLEDQSRSLGEILIDQGTLTYDVREMLESSTGARRELDAHSSVSALDSGEGSTEVVWPGRSGEVGARWQSRRKPLAVITAAEGCPPADRVDRTMRYRVLWPHAKGGIGQVHVAEDLELNRKVALKEIQLRHVDNRISRERFLFEAEVTANLEHPGIVPVYGRGSHPDGRPYYAMRLIKGEQLATAIHRFHSSERPDFTSLEFRWLLQRFHDVCNTVAYAHNRGILHRDLKPTNIMLGPFGETLVMDWGLARPFSATDDTARAEDETPEESSTPSEATPKGNRAPLTGHTVGTPAYMSPEQSLGMLEALGPPSDVYSLGATLYVILTDQRPFEGADVLQVLSQVRSGRYLTPRQINHQVPLQLDAICRRAMAVRPRDRYQSALDLAADLERWLANEPVSVWREPFTHRARRWVRRHQTMVAGWAVGVVVMLIALSIAVPLLSLAWRNESRARRDEHEQRIIALRHADDALRQEALAQTQANIAKEERERAQKALQFLVAAFRKPDPAIDGHSLKVVELLTWAVRDLNASLGDQPLMKATVLTAIGKTFAGLGLSSESVSALLQAFNLRREHLGENHRDTLTSMDDLAMAYQDAGRLDQALPILESVLEKRRRELGADHPEFLESMNDLAVALWEYGAYNRAIPIYEKALAVARHQLGDRDPLTLTIMDNLAVCYTAAGRAADAIPLHELALENLRATLGPDDLTTLITTNNLARSYESGGRLPTAIALHEANIARLKVKLGDDHPTTLMATHGLARAYEKSGALSRAIALYESTLAKRRSRLGDEHPDTLRTLLALAEARAHEGSAGPAAAVPLAREFLERAEKIRERLPANLRPALARARSIIAGPGGVGRTQPGPRDAIDPRAAGAGPPSGSGSQPGDPPD